MVCNDILTLYRESWSWIRFEFDVHVTRIFQVNHLVHHKLCVLNLHSSPKYEGESILNHYQFHHKYWFRLYFVLSPNYFMNHHCSKCFGIIEKTWHGSLPILDTSLSLIQFYLVFLNNYCTNSLFIISFMYYWCIGQIQEVQSISKYISLYYLKVYLLQWNVNSSEVAVATWCRYLLSNLYNVKVVLLNRNITFSVCSCIEPITSHWTSEFETC